MTVRKYESLDEFPLHQGEKEEMGGSAEETDPAPGSQEPDLPVHRYGPRVPSRSHLPFLLAGVVLAVILFLNFLMWRHLNIRIDEGFTGMKGTGSAADSGYTEKIRGAMRPYMHVTGPLFTIRKDRNTLMVRLSYTLRNVGILPGNAIEIGSWLDTIAAKQLVDHPPVIERSIPTLYPNEEKEAMSLVGEVPLEHIIRSPYLHIAASYAGPDGTPHRVTEIFYCSIVKSGIESALVWTAYE